MSDKKIQKKFTKDQVKHNHKEAFKGHKTKKHYLNEVQNDEAEQDILDSRKDKYGER